VPIIIVFTKLDLLVAKLKRGVARGKDSQASAEKYFNEQYGPVIEKTKITAGQVPYTLVSSTFTSENSLFCINILM
jgi:hypothetical protein